MPRCKHCRAKFEAKYFLQKYCLKDDECIDAELKERAEKLASKEQKPKAKIKNVSDKQIERLAKYRKVRDEFMKLHPMCQARLAGCTIKATDLHHAKGKIGDLLTDKRYFKALCRKCHSYIETHPDWAKEMGYSLNRLENHESN